MNAITSSKGKKKHKEGRKEGRAVRYDKFGINKCDKPEWKITRLTQMVAARAGKIRVYMHRMHANMKVSNERLQ